MTYYQMLIQ